MSKKIEIMDITKCVFSEIERKNKNIFEILPLEIEEKILEYLDNNDKYILNYTIEFMSSYYWEK